jgi:hypothetical protein
MGVQVTTAASQIDKQRLGYQAISLTEYDTTAEPEIVAGSKVEVGGALYEFTVDEAGTGWGGIAVSTECYIALVPSGATVSWIYTTTAPTWNTEKQGWYSGANRYVFHLYKDASGNYANKSLLTPAVENTSWGAKVFLPGVTGPFLHVQDQKASGTASGTFTSGAWQTRVLNTVLTNTIPGASLASNQILIPAGTYYLEAFACGYNCDQHKAKIRRITATAADLLIGLGEFPDFQSLAQVFGRFTVEIDVAIELQHRCTTTSATRGFGMECTYSVVEVYADVQIWRIS